MKTPVLTVLLLSAALLAGCQHHGGHARSLPAPGVAGDAWLVQERQTAFIDAGIIAQHTLYPYHFVADGAKLNELGQRDLAVLAAHFRENPGQLNVAQGDTDKGLYDQRVRTVSTALVSAGVDTARIRIADDLPGGPGVSSQRLVTIITESQRRTRGTERTLEMNLSDSGATGSGSGSGTYGK